MEHALSGKTIVIATSGFVFVGNLTEVQSPCGWYTRLEDAACVRRWGTTAGIGQLALSGPTKDTVLDACGVVEIAHHAVIGRIPC